MSDEGPDPANEVLSFTLYRTDPQCTEYSFAVKSEYGIDDPLHLEQLNVLHEIVCKYREQAEKMLILKTLQANRAARNIQKEHFDIEINPDKVH